jgi:hypothetical protein
VEQFKVFRAIGLSFKAWFANFIPITLLAAVLYAPVILYVTTLSTSEGLEKYLEHFQHGLWALLGVSALLAPMITYRIIQYMNGSSSSIITSIKFGFRGVLPAIILAAVTSVVQMVPFGGIIGTIITCYWFVCAPAAVVERLNPVAALSRSSALTQGRRGGIFGLCFLISLIVIAIFMIWMVPAVSNGKESSFKSMVLAMVVIISVYQLFMGIVQAVSYSLLRGDKDGVSNEELAKVFE